MKHTLFLFLTVASFCLLNFTSCKKDDYLDWKYLNEAWLDQHRNDESWITEPSGLQYRVIYPGVNVATPPDKSTVIIKYKGEFINGKEFRPEIVDSREITGYPYGLREGIKKMRRNAIYEFRVPYKSGFGDETTSVWTYTMEIPAYSTLIYRVELINFESYIPE